MPFLNSIVQQPSIIQSNAKILNTDNKKPQQSSFQKVLETQQAKEAAKVDAENNIGVTKALSTAVNNGMNFAEEVHKQGAVNEINLVEVKEAAIALANELEGILWTIAFPKTDGLWKDHFMSQWVMAIVSSSNDGEMSEIAQGFYEDILIKDGISFDPIVPQVKQEA